MCSGTVVVQDARQDTKGSIPSEADFNHWVLLPGNGEELPGEVVVRIVDIEEIQQMNFDYRGINKPTNVLSFSYGDDAEAGFGDIVICAPVVLQEAQERGIPASHHWAHLTVHGVLHLMGYDHETEAQAAAMESLEIDCMNQLNIANPYEGNFYKTGKES